MRRPSSGLRRCGPGKHRPKPCRSVRHCLRFPSPEPVRSRGPTNPCRPNEPQLERLSELLGTLTYMRALCGKSDAAEWRKRMTALLDAEAQSSSRRERLAGAYNRGFRGYEATYRECTPSADLVIARDLAESDRLAREPRVPLQRNLKATPDINLNTGGSVNDLSRVGAVPGTIRTVQLFHDGRDLSTSGPLRGLPKNVRSPCRS